MDDDDEGPISIAEAESVRALEQERDALQHRVVELEQRNEGAPQPVQTVPDEQPQRAWWQFWRRS